jgi:uncharacterized protein (TIGR03083 family)
MTLDYPYALAAERYRELLEDDFRRLRALVEEAGDRPVPSCPGWTAADVVRHTATVYLHKVASIRDGAMPTPDSGWPPEQVRTGEPGPLLEDAYRQLVEQLDHHSPEDHAATWWPPDQTVGFWLRRMAHETSIHRRDVEGAVGAETPVAPDLAVDGIDEVLALMLAGDWSDEVVPEASGATVLLEADGHRWAVTLLPDEVTLDRPEADSDQADSDQADSDQADSDPAGPDPAGSEPAASTARVAGEPGQLLLWLWGRGPQPSGSGSPAAVNELRARLAMATQ